jgi:phosphohistidine phosphatase
MALQNLILMRHAKSSWNFDDLSDHQRPLNGRGRKAAKKIGQVLRAKSLFPQTIWSSDSTRTRETVSRLLGDAKGLDAAYLKGFYHAGANNVLYLCQERGEPKTGPLMLVGHNPGWEELVYYFTGTSRRMPTGACAIFRRIDDKADWLSPEAWKLQELILPRDLED